MLGLRPTTVDRKLLPEVHLSGPAPWVIGIMMFLMILAAAGGLGLGRAANSLRGSIATRLTIQVVEANGDAREAQARAVLAALRHTAGVLRFRRIGEAEMGELLAPWLGGEAIGSDLPLPAMIDVELDDAGRAQPVVLAIGRIAPAARIDEHARVLAPLAGLIVALRWLASAIVVLMALATAAAVVLASSGALNTHRPTIDVMHLLGATDVQIARIFQRRIAIDALFGGMIGLAGALAVMLVLRARFAALGSELVGAMALEQSEWLLLFLLPFAGMALAMLVTRFTVLRLLRSQL